MAGVGPARAWADYQMTMAAREHDARVRAAGIPIEYQNKGFEDFRCQTDRASEISKALQNYCVDFSTKRYMRTGFLFVGAPGTAKTHIACAMVQSLLSQGFVAKYTSLPRLTQQLRSRFGRPGAVDELLKSSADADLLVLDEIDLHGSSDNDYNILYDIINARYEKPGSPTVAISNRNVDRLSQDLDERITSRILSNTKPMHFDWPGQRGVRQPAMRGASR